LIYDATDYETTKSIIETTVGYRSWPVSIALSDDELLDFSVDLLAMMHGHIQLYDYVTFRKPNRKQKKMVKRLYDLTQAELSQRRKNPRRRNNGKDGFNAARSMLRKEYAAEYGDDWWKDQSLKDEMYDRLDDMGPWK
jgi:hypothetical protein